MPSTTTIRLTLPWDDHQWSELAAHVGKPNFSTNLTTADSITFSTPTCTLTTASCAPFKPSHKGQRITIAGSYSAGNNGTFQITEVISPTQITWKNTSGVAHAQGAYTYISIADGFNGMGKKESIQFLRNIIEGIDGGTISGQVCEWPNGYGGGTDAIVASTTYSTLTVAGYEPFTSEMVGDYITLSGQTTAANNGSFLIKTVTSSKIIVYTTPNAGTSENCPATGKFKVTAMSPRVEFQIGGKLARHASQTFTWSDIGTTTKKITVNSVDVVGVTSTMTVKDSYLVGATKYATANNCAARLNASNTAGLTGIAFAVNPGHKAFATMACVSAVNTDTVWVGGCKFVVSTYDTGVSATKVWAAPYYDIVTAGLCYVKVGASNTDMGTYLTEAINNHPVLSKQMVASNSSGTVTLTALTVGAWANSIAGPTQTSGATITCVTFSDGFDPVGPPGFDAGTDGAVTTVYATTAGALGNKITTTTDDSTHCTAGGSTMAGGLGDDALPYIWMQTT